MPVEVLPVGLPPADAIAWFRERVPMTKDEWEKLQDRARRRAFTVAGVAQLDLVTDVWAAINRAVTHGETLEQFKAAVGERLAAAWGGADPHRLETIYRTNVQMAYQAGRYRQMTEPAVLRTRPFWLFDSVIDNATTQICRDRDQTIRPADDEWWKTNYPPLHFRCRSGVRSLTKRQAEARGITVEPIEEDPSTGFGLAPIPEEWGRAWAAGVMESTVGRKWVPAISGEVPGPATYGRPKEIPRVPLPTKLLPTIKEAGDDVFRDELAAAWGGSVVTVEDPTGIGVVLSEDLLNHLKPDTRERFLGLVPDVIADPFEIWLLPMLDEATGSIAFRMKYVKYYSDEKDRPLLFVAEMQKGIWTGFTVFSPGSKKYLQGQRQGFLRYGKPTES